MYIPHRPRRPIYIRVSKKFKLLLIVALVLAFLIPSSIYLRKISSQAALTEAIDMITYATNEAVAEIMATEGYDYDDFVIFEKDIDGKITAFSTNTTLINALSTELMRTVIDKSASGSLDIRIPMGNLIGMSTMQGRGPKIPVEIIMLTSSHADYSNEFVSSGINQTKHRISLNVTVNIVILIPWATIETAVQTEVLLVETVIIGEVPETYITLE